MVTLYTYKYAFMIRYYLLFWIIFCAYSFPAQAKESRANSIFWEIRGGDLKKPAYIYGTMHVSSKIAFKLPYLFFQKLEEADVIALESVPDEWESKIVQDSMLNYINQIYKHREGSALHQSYDFYTQLLGVFGISEGYLKWILSRQSSMANQLLFRNNSFSGNLAEQTYLDLYIYQVGKKFGKPIIGLEDIRTSTLKGYIASLEEYARVDNNKDKFDDIGLALTDAYKNKDIDKIDSCNTKAYSEGYLENLLYSRNRDMMVTFDSVVEKGISPFMAVGAAHLPGEKGLLHLLEKRGYTVTPIYDTVYHDPSLALVMYDDIFIPTQAEQHWSIDSSLYFEAPGYAARRIETGLVEYLCADMANGVYYKIDRVPLFHGFVDNGNMENRVDSLLYESTSGKILEKKKTKVQDYPAIRVKSKSSESKNVWSLYIFTPYELIIAEVKGPEKWNGEENALAFIQSIRTQYNTEIVSVENGALASRSYSTITDLPYSEFDLNIPNYMQYGTDGRYDYLTIRSKRHGKDGIEEDLYETQAMIRAFANIIGAEIVQMKSSPHEGRMVSNASLRNSVGTIEVETRVRAESYLLLATNTNNKKSKQFAQTTLSDETPSAHDERVYTNDSLHYSLPTYVSPYGADLNPYIFLQQVRHSTFARDDLKTVHINYFQNPRYGYDVELSIKQVNPYAYFASSDSLWSKYTDYVEKEFVHDRSNTIHVLDSVVEDKLQRKIFKVSDSSSSTYTLVSISLTDDKEYVLSTVLDSSSDLSKTVAAQVQSFEVQAQDKLYSLQSTFDTFFTHMFSEDSLTQLVFENNKGHYKPSVGDIPRILTLLDTSENLQRRKKLYYEVLGYLSAYPSATTLSFLKKLYTINSKNFDTQFEVLKTLSEMKDTAATLLFKELIIDSPPLESANSPSYVSGVFTILTPYRLDTTLTPLLYPEILELIDYDEYYGPIKSMTALQSRFCDLDTNLYASKIPHFYKKLRAEYRRQTSQQTLLELDDKKIELSDNKNKNYYSSKNSYSVSSVKLSDSYIESTISTYNYYNLFSYYEILRKYRHRPEVDVLLSIIDSSDNTDLQLYRSLDRMEDSLDYDTSPIAQHISRERYCLKLTEILEDFNQYETLQKISPKADSFAVWLSRLNLSIDKDHENLSIYDKQVVKIQGQEKTLYVFEYNKKDLETRRFAFLGFFTPDHRYLDEYVWLDDVKLDELKMTSKEFVQALQVQFDAIDRAFVSPADYSIYLDPERRDPFRFLLYN